MCYMSIKRSKRVSLLRTCYYSRESKVSLQGRYHCKECKYIRYQGIFVWVKKIGKIVDEMVKKGMNQVQEIVILEMNELCTYVKKSQKELGTQENLGIHTPEY